MSIPHRQVDYEEQWRQQQQETGIIVAAITLAIFVVPIWIIGRAIYFLNSVPGRDVDGNGYFSVTDIWKCGQYAFNEPAWNALGWIPYEFFRFFEVTSTTLPPWLLFLVAVICWIAIGIGLAVVGVFVGRGFVYLGKGATFGIGRVQMRLPNLMPMDVIIITAVVIVMGGFGLGMLINSFS